MKEFDKETLEFSLPKRFKGLEREYIIDCIFDEEIQKNWKPGVSDLIVGCIGTIFVISAVDNSHERLSGKRYYFNDGSYNKDGGRALDSEEQSILYHSSIRDFRYVPYPHERSISC